jgi:hypothetical protein
MLRWNDEDEEVLVAEVKSGFTLKLSFNLSNDN